MRLYSSISRSAMPVLLHVDFGEQTHDYVSKTKKTQYQTHKRYHIQHKVKHGIGNNYKKRYTEF